MENKENVLEFLSGQYTCTVTFTNQKHINRVKKLYEERKELLHSAGIHISLEELLLKYKQINNKE